MNVIIWMGSIVCDSKSIVGVMAGIETQKPMKSIKPMCVVLNKLGLVRMNHN